MKNREDPKKFYHISAVAQMYDIHPQTLRLYEREGLLKPSRSDGNTRLYSEDDLRQLEFILSLTRELGVNLAGVEVILSMREKMEQMQELMEQLIYFMQTELQKREGSESIQASNALVKMAEKRIVVKSDTDGIFE